MTERTSPIVKTESDAMGIILRGENFSEKEWNFDLNDCRSIGKGVTDEVESCVSSTTPRLFQ